MGFSVISLDTTLWAYVSFWCGWRLARRRSLGARSFVLHSQAMAAGCGFTMTILFQRPVQFIMIVVRKCLLTGVEFLPPSNVWLRWGMEGFAHGFLDHNVCLSLSTAVMGWFHVLLLDGPRSWIVISMLDLSEEEIVEIFGSKEPSSRELLFCRLRIPFYLVVRAIVTDCWTQDPDIVPD